MFQGYMRLAADKNGSIEENPEPLTIEANEKENLSLTEYELAQ